jgi:hypothetical protein
VAGYWFIVVTLFVFPLLLFGWVLRQRTQPDRSAEAERSARTSMLGLIGVLTLAVIIYQSTVRGGLQQTAALFILIPAVLAAAVLFAPAKSAKAVACKSVTIGLLIGLVFLGEGMLCILMTAPLYYLVAILVGAAIDSKNNARDVEAHRRIFSCVVALSIMPMGFEGVTPATTFPRDNVVSVTRIIAAGADDIADAIRRHPRFERPLPWWLTIGFPRPMTTSANGDTLHVEMRGGEMRLNGLEPRTGTLVLRREDLSSDSTRWNALSDDSHMRHFLTWQSSEVRWRALDGRTTEVTWTIRYRRDLDPAWYFGPMERAAVRMAAAYLIDAVATP